MKDKLYNLNYILKLAYMTDKIFFVLSFMFFSLFSLLPILNLLILRYLVNALIFKYSINTVLVVLIIYSTVYFIISALNNWYDTYYSVIFEKKLQKQVQNVVFNKIKLIDLKYYDDNTYFNKFIKALNETNTRPKEIFDTVLSVYSNILMSISIILIMLQIKLSIIILTIILVTINTLIISLKNKYYYNQYIDTIDYERKKSYTSRVFYLKNYAKELRAFNIWHIFIDLFNYNTDKAILINKQYAKKILLLDFLVSFVSVAIIIITYLIIILNIYSGKLLVSDLVTLTSASQTLTSSLTTFFMVFSNIQKHSLYVQNLIDFMNIEENKNVGLEHIESFNHIKFKNISFGYDNKDILHNLNLVIQKNQITAITGCNGQGKSTLIKLMLNLYPPHKGNILINDVDIQDIDKCDINNLYSILFQDYQIYSLTIAENILLKPLETKQEQQRVYEILDMLGLKEKIINLPQGILTPITKEFSMNGVEFSGGEFQKIAIARALYKDTPVVILDEPTSNLDTISEQKLCSYLKEISNTKTIILISHKLSVSNIAHKVYRIENGNLINSKEFNKNV